MRCNTDLDSLFGSCTVTACMPHSGIVKTGECPVGSSHLLSRQAVVPSRGSCSYVCLFLASSRTVEQLESQPPHDIIPLLQNNGPQLTTGAITFANNYALQPNAIDIPTRDVSVEFWARTPSATHSSNDHNALSDILDIASHTTSMCPLAM